MQEKALPLSGYRVVELSTVVATPITGRLFSDYGADVFKVEAPPYGDLLRPTGKGHDLPAEDGNNPLFDMMNSGKKLLSFDLKQPDGMRAFHKLLAGADVFITNVRMQSLVRMGLDYDTLKAKYPALVYGHFSGFGLEGDEVNRPGFDQTAFWFRSGAATDMQTPDSFPVRASFGFGDITTASAFMSGLLMALLAREKTGCGTMVATSLQRSAIWCCATSIVNSQPQYGKEYPVDRYHPWDPFSDFYRCSDGEWIAFMEKKYETDRRLFAGIFDMPELLTDPDLSSLDKMREAGKVPEVAKRLELVFKAKTSDEWMTILDDNDVANERARHYKDVYTDRQARANGCFEDVEYPDGTTAIPTPPVTFSEYRRRPFEKTGPVGRDTYEVLKSLGYSAAEIERLRQAKAVL